MGLGFDAIVNHTWLISGHSIIDLLPINQVGLAYWPGD
jgi:hypothetical protein